MQRAGTRGYMSPEQLLGKVGEIDIRSDVYALGVMLLELLTPIAMLDRAAEAGLDNRDLHAALLASLGQEAVANADVTRDLGAIPAQLRWLIARAIDPQRARRYDSAQALAEDIDRYLRRYPLHAVPSTPTYRLRCFVTRNRGQMIAAGLIALALIAGTSAAVVGMLRAREAAERANLEAEKSRQTSQFLTDVLSGVDPEQARDLDKTLLHLVLDKAAARADKELADQPEVLADIQNTIGGSYSGLSEYKRALEHVRRAYDVARAHLGADALPTLKIEHQLARQLLNTGQQNEAEELLVSNVAALTRTRGATDRQTLDSILDLVRTQRERGEYAAAEQRIEALLPAIERNPEAKDKLEIDALDMQATVLTDLGRYTEAEPIFHNVVERETAQYGADYPKTLDSMNSFAIMYMESQRYAEGAKILASMLPIEEKLYGPDHAVTLNIVSNLAGALRQQGTPEKLAESGPYYRRALEGVRKKFGDRHMNTIIATHNYANYLLDVGDTTQAIALQQQALISSTELLGADHAVTGEIHFGLGKALLRAQRYTEAEAQLQAAVAEKQKDLGADHWRMGEYLDKLIEAYKADGKNELAGQWESKRAGLKPKPAGES
jgi:non-specific serine/threonine protein kinase/serine/threonine-protein kinase